MRRAAQRVSTAAGLVAHDGAPRIAAVNPQQSMLP